MQEAEYIGQLVGVTDPVLANQGRIAQRLSLGHQRTAQRIAFRGEHRRVEQHQRVPVPDAFDDGEQGGDRRHRVECADSGLLAPFLGNRAVHRCAVAREAKIVVRLGRVERISPAVAKIEQGEVEPFQHQPPEREVGIAGESVSVAQHDARPGRVAVAHDAYRRPVVHRKVEGCGGFRQDEPGCPPPALHAGIWRSDHLAATIGAAGSGHPSIGTSLSTTTGQSCRASGRRLVTRPGSASKPDECAP